MIKQIFTWWNGSTLGTKVWTFLFGIQVGIDEDKNVYFQNKKDTKRWVIYSGVIESTKINPEWNNWLRFTSSSVPTFDQKYKWQKEHTPNQTGTENAYNPEQYQSEPSTKDPGYKKWDQKDN